MTSYAEERAVSHLCYLDSARCAAVTVEHNAQAVFHENSCFALLHVRVPSLTNNRNRQVCSKALKFENRGSCSGAKEKWVIKIFLSVGSEGSVKTK